MPKRNLKLWIAIGTGFLLIVSVVLLVNLIILHRWQKPQESSETSNFNSIYDSSIGLSFNMDKALEPIPRGELTALNPGFLYGFRASNSPSTQCIISQTKLNSPVQVSNGSLNYLHQGTFNEVKKNHNDAKLEDWSVVKVDDKQGAFLQMTYTDKGQKIKRVELVIPGKSALTFAYCQSPNTDSDQYYKDFSSFFSSLKVQ